MRVLHVTEAPLGGVVAYLEEVLSAQSASLDQVTLITPEVNVAALADIPPGRLSLVTFAHQRGSLAGLARMAQATVRQARATRPDILHVHSTFAGAVVRLCRPLIPRATRIVYCPHGWAFSRLGSAWKNRVLALTERLLSRGCDRIICISDHERREALAAGIPATKLVVIENGVSPRAVPDMPRKPGLLIAFAGRFDRQKGFDTYCEVMRRLDGHATGIAIGQAIVTNGAPQPIPPNVEVLGWQPRDRVFALYAQADLLLVPSRWEGFGLVAIEAMQARTAVFAARVGGLQDIVMDEKTGRLFNPDAVEDIVTMIRQTNRETLLQYGAQGYSRYNERYTSGRMNGLILQLYRDMAIGKSRKYRQAATP